MNERLKKGFDTGWFAADVAGGWDVVGDDCTGTDQGVGADGDAGQNYSSGTDGSAVANGRGLGVVGFVTGLGVAVVSEDDARADEDVRADGGARREEDSVADAGTRADVSATANFGMGTDGAVLGDGDACKNHRKVPDAGGRIDDGGWVDEVKRFHKVPEVVWRFRECR